MLNIYPRGNYVEIRAGNSNFATGMTGTAATLALHSSMAGTETLFCSTQSGIYNVSSAGAVGASVLARTNGRHQWVNYGDGTNNWLIMCNGVDKPAYYNGTTWTAVDGGTTPAITGVTTTTLIGVCVYQGRLFFIQTGTLKTWYLPSGVVGGAAVAFDLSTQAARGGYLMAAMNWTFDGGSGSEDHIAFVTSMGEVIVYAGVDPATAADWNKVGTYYIGKPLGRQCMCKYGGDLLVLTEDGVVALSGALSGVVNESKYKLSDKVKNRYLVFSQTYGSLYGWQMLVYPKENALIVNMPFVENTNSSQLVMNSQTGAWTEFNSWDATSYCVYDKNLHYCLGTKTVKAWSGVSDAANSDTTISAFFYSSYSNFGVNVYKDLKAIRFQTQGNASNATITAGVVDEIKSPTQVTNSTTATVLANVANTIWWNPPSYGGTWFSGYFQNVQSVNGGLLKIFTVEYLYEIGTITNV